MKKLLFVFTVAAFLAACNGNSKTGTTTDSTNVNTTVDSTNTVAPATTDTTHAMDSTHTMGADSTRR